MLGTNVEHSRPYCHSVSLMVNGSVVVPENQELTKRNSEGCPTPLKTVSQVNRAHVHVLKVETSSCPVTHVMRLDVTDKASGGTCETHEKTHVNVQLVSIDRHYHNNSATSSAMGSDNDSDRGSLADDSDSHGYDSGFGNQRQWHIARKCTDDDKDVLHFHLHELDTGPNQLGKNLHDQDDKDSAIMSVSGTVRGVRNRVRTQVSCLFQPHEKRNYVQEEEGRVVLYTTTMGIIRRTFEKCRHVRNILQTLLVKFEERDVFMNRTHQRELLERLETGVVQVPQIFVEGNWFANAEILESLNESGELRQVLRPYKRSSFGGVCQQCGGFRYLPCSLCGGSKKSANHRHHFNIGYVALRCMNCDESGLIRCDKCLHGDG
ncbi:glutaredoxin domain-containing cysteine-rich protein CG12206-like [Limulus polyphemus]|uniref:Glutaredoxin domain-containing cysteine-rich protein CG12206-like n=1 Tax=Limulus polyphemus TaxID=6850 RepID=A0ABM1BI78_LIMPO|nr:glutaredoxin domain-containing cysteine-rich protein CG12206-like [Limulus polyphemus]